MTHNPHTGAPVRAPSHSIWSLVAVAALALLLGGMVISTATDTLRPAPTVRVVPVVAAPSTEAPTETATADAPRPTVTVQAPGWIEADPYTTACTALAEGVVESIHVLEGQRVEAGQLVATLVKDDARLALDRARAELATARAELEAAETDWANPVQRVRAVEFERAELAETEAQLAQLPALIAAERAMLERMQEDLARLQNAQRSNAANAFEVVIRQKDVDRQQALLDAVTQRRPILEAQRDRERAKLKAAEREFELRVEEKRALDAARATVANHEARVAEAELRLRRMEIHAPIAGLVQKRLKRPGDKVMFANDSEHSAHLIHIYDPQDLQVRVDVPLADASNVFVGQRCEVVVDVLPDTTFKGEVTRITHEADLQKNTLQVKVRVIDPPLILKPEMLTRVKFLPDSPVASGGGVIEQSAPVLVMADAIRDRAGDSATVWVVRDRRNGKGTARPVNVRIVEEADDLARVRADLCPGDLLVSGDTAITEGQRVKLAQLDTNTGGRQ